MLPQVPNSGAPPADLWPFAPTPWLRGPHRQTVGARVLRSRRAVRLDRERLPLPDGDTLLLDWAVVAGASPAPGPLVVVLHGLEGSASSKYALEVYRQLALRGCAAIGLNFRSCGGELNRGPRLYHSGETADLRCVIDWLRARRPQAALGAIGFSLGGNVLLKYLGEEGRAGRPPRLAAAAAVSVPYDLAAGADYMEHGLARLYVRRLLHSLKAKVRQRARDLGDRIDVAGALRATTFRAFDDAATAPLHGFAHAADYYARSSSGPYLPSIDVPTRLVHALDDPFLPATAVPLEALRANAHLDPWVAREGGHVGFVEGPLGALRFAAERLAAEFVAARLVAASGVTR